MNQLISCYKFERLFLLTAFLIACQGDVNVNVIPEVFDAPGGIKGTFFGASLAIKGHNQILTGAPYKKSGGGIFKCSLESSRTCSRYTSYSGSGMSKSNSIIKNV